LSRIDFALCTKSLASEILKADIIDSLPGVELKCASDHYPVLVEFSAKSDDK
jgi:exonuclease III